MTGPFLKRSVLRVVLALTAALAAAGPAAAQTTYTGGSFAIPLSGTANPYPGAILVADFPRSVGSITATVSGFTHSAVDDVGVLLVKRNAPGGTVLASVVLFKGAGGDGAGGEPLTTADNVTLTFDDASNNFLSNIGPATLQSGTYKPGLDQYQDGFAAPAPPGEAGAYPGDFAQFSNAPGNGVYELYVQDFPSTAQDGGSITGWSITLTPVPEPASALAACGLVAVGLPALRRRGEHCRFCR